LVIADISGYTGYVVESPLEHAEDVLTDVTALVAEHLGQVLSLNKQEGDAIFGYAVDDSLDGTMLLDTIEECYLSFRNRLVGIERATSCNCNACAKLPELDLKFVVPSARARRSSSSSCAFRCRLRPRGSFSRLRPSAPSGRGGSRSR
jgi:hypothetical protein